MSEGVLPAPLSAADCDLRGYEYMPLFGHRLFGSDFDAKANDMEFRIAMRLWWAAWQQCPAGSLPSEDTALCRLADLGRDIKTWKKVKGMVLRHFVLCSDDRLYHPLLCDQAKDAYERRRRDRERKAAMRAAKRTSGGTDGGGSVGSSPSVHVPSNGNADVVPQTDVMCPTDIPADKATLSHGQSVEMGVERTKEREEVAATPLLLVQTPREPEPVAAHRTPTHMPRLSDPPSEWLCVSDKRENDGAGVAHPVISGHYVDLVAKEVCETARINLATWRGNWQPVLVWLKLGIGVHEVILPTVKRMAARPGYPCPPKSLNFFHAAVLEAAGIALEDVA